MKQQMAAVMSRRNCKWASVANLQSRRGIVVGILRRKLSSWLLARRVLLLYDRAGELQRHKMMAKLIHIVGKGLDDDTGEQWLSSSPGPARLQSSVMSHGAR